MTYDDGYIDGFKAGMQYAAYSERIGLMSLTHATWKEYALRVQSLSPDSLGYVDGFDSGREFYPISRAS